MTPSALRQIEPARLTADLEHLATLVDPDFAGWTRQALSTVDVAGRDWVRARMAEAGLDTRVDDAGNVFGRLAGSHPGAVVDDQ
jgi:N-carbamoyl-L-amino-acid hydrolase